MGGKYTQNESELPLRDVVFRTLRRQILMGELHPGERLMEVKLTKKLGVSRTPVREAIHMLEIEGLAVVRPKRGASVANINEEDLQDVLEVRCALEELAVSLACERRNDEELERLRNAARSFIRATKSGNIEEMAERDVEFHNIIFAMTGNKRLIQLVENLFERMYRYRLEYLKNSEVYAGLIKEHGDIIKYLEENSPKEAKDAIKRHITNQVETVSMEIKAEKGRHNEKDNSGHTWRKIK